MSNNVECFSCNKTYVYGSEMIYKRCEHKYLCHQCWMGKTGQYLYMTDSELVCKICEQEDKEFFEWATWV